MGKCHQHVDGLADDLRAHLAGLKAGERVRAIVRVNLEDSTGAEVSSEMSVKTRGELKTARGNRFIALLPMILRDLHESGCSIISHSQPDQKRGLLQASFFVEISRAEAVRLGRCSWVKPPIMMDQELKLPPRGPRE